MTDATTTLPKPETVPARHPERGIGHVCRSERSEESYPAAESTPHPSGHTKPPPSAGDRLLIALCAASAVTYALCSDAVRVCVTEITRLAQKL